MLRIDPDYLGLFRALAQVTSLPEPVLAALASKASDRQNAVAAPTDGLAGAQTEPVGSGGTSRHGMGSTVHLTPEDKAEWITAKFTENERQCAVWVHSTIMGPPAGRYTGSLDPIDLKRISLLIVSHYEAFPG